MKYNTTDSSGEPTERFWLLKIVTAVIAIISYFFFIQFIFVLLRNRAKSPIFFPTMIQVAVACIICNSSYILIVIKDYPNISVLIRESMGLTILSLLTVYSLLSYFSLMYDFNTSINKSTNKIIVFLLCWIIPLLIGFLCKSTQSKGIVFHLLSDSLLTIIIYNIFMIVCLIANFILISLILVFVYNCIKEKEKDDDVSVAIHFKKILYVFMIFQVYNYLLFILRAWQNWWHIEKSCGGEGSLAYYLVCFFINIFHSLNPLFAIYIYGFQGSMWEQIRKKGCCGDGKFSNEDDISVLKDGKEISSLGESIFSGAICNLDE